MAGYSGLRSEIRELRNDMRVGRLPQLMGPVTPLDEIKHRKKQISNNALDRALGYEPEVT